MRENGGRLPECRGVLRNIQHAIGVLALEADTGIFLQVACTCHDAHALSLALLGGRVAENEGQFDLVLISELHDLGEVRAVEGLDEGTVLGNVDRFLGRLHECRRLRLALQVVFVPVGGMSDGLKVSALSLGLDGEEFKDSSSKGCGHVELHRGDIELSRATKPRTSVKPLANRRTFLGGKFQEERNEVGKRWPQRAFYTFSPCHELDRTNS